jgi:hypothetical protein
MLHLLSLLTLARLLARGVHSASARPASSAARGMHRHLWRQSESVNALQDIPYRDILMVMDCDHLVEPEFFAKCCAVMLDRDVAVCLVPQARVASPPRAALFHARSTSPVDIGTDVLTRRGLPRCATAVDASPAAPAFAGAASLLTARCFPCRASTMRCGRTASTTRTTISCSGSCRTTSAPAAASSPVRACCGHGEAALLSVLHRHVQLCGPTAPVDRRPTLWHARRVLCALFSLSHDCCHAATRSDERKP